MILSSRITYDYLRSAVSTIFTTNFLSLQFSTDFANRLKPTTKCYSEEVGSIRNSAPEFRVVHLLRLFWSAISHNLSSVTFTHEIQSSCFLDFGSRSSRRTAVHRLQYGLGHGDEVEGENMTADFDTQDGLRTYGLFLARVFVFLILLVFSGCLFFVRLCHSYGLGHELRFDVSISRAIRLRLVLDHGNSII